MLAGGAQHDGAAGGSSSSRSSTEDNSAISGTLMWLLGGRLISTSATMPLWLTLDEFGHLLPFPARALSGSVEAATTTGTMAGGDVARIERDGVGIYYETHGNGPPVLLSHGYSATCRMWDAQIAALVGSLSG